MANWKYRIVVKDAWRQAKDGKITVQEFSAIVARKLKALPPYRSDEELISLVDDFESLAEDKHADTEDFDETWERLYEWGDIILDHAWPTEKMCWIATV